MSDCANYYTVEPEKRKTLHPNRTFALFCGNPMHRSLRQVSKLKVDLLGSSSDNYIMFTLFYDIWYVISYEWAPCSNSTSSGQVLWKILKTCWPFLSFFTSSGELCETNISFYIVLYHHIIYYVIWQDFMLKFDLLNIHSVLAFWRHFDQFCQSSKQETAILLGGKARLDTPSFTPLGSQTCILITYYIVTLLLTESQG